MPNCKIGDLAVVVRSRSAPENVGKLVKVIALAGVFSRGEGFTVDGHLWRSENGGTLWLCETAGSPLVSYQRGTGRKSTWQRRPFIDSSLRPIRPDEEPDSTTEPADLGVPTTEGVSS